MAFKQPKRTARVVFEVGDYAGFELVVSIDEPIGRFLQVQRMVDAGTTSLEQLCEMLAALVQEWNLEDEGGPVPVSPEGFERLSIGTILVILTKWMEVQTSPEIPLGQPSRNGATSLVPSTSTGTSLENPES